MDDSGSTSGEASSHSTEAKSSFPLIQPSTILRSCVGNIAQSTKRWKSSSQKGDGRVLAASHPSTSKCKQVDFHPTNQKCVHPTSRITLELAQNEPNRTGYSTPSPPCNPRSIVEDAVLANNGQTEDDFEKVHIEWNELIYQVTIRRTSLFGAFRSKRTIVDRVSGKASAGSMTAVCGPSGSGKTTLLDILSGRLRTGNRSGEILVNGREPEDNFLSQTGYLTQEDTVHSLLTVKENIMYNIRLCLPDTVSMEEKLKIADESIQMLALNCVANSLVGDIESRGISGGEKRRLSIAMERARNPSLFFLDEPISGLDSTNASVVLRSLRCSVEEGRTVVTTIHQPARWMLELFDSLLIISHGCTLYFGPPKVLGIYLENFRRNQLNVSHFQDEFYNMDQWMPLEIILDLAVNFHIPLKCFWNRTCNEFNGAVLAKSREIVLHMNPLAKRRFALNWFQETKVLFSRLFRSYCRKPTHFWGRIIVYVVHGTVLGSLFLNIGFTFQGLLERQSMYLVTVAVLYATSVAGLPDFHRERIIVVKDTYRGAHRIATFVLAQTLVRTPTLLPFALAYGTPVWYMVGLDEGLMFENYAFFIFQCWVIFCVANSMVLALTVLVEDLMFAFLIASLCNSGLLLFCGFFVTKENIPVYWIWLYWANPVTYSLNGLLKNDFQANTKSWNCPVISDFIDTRIPIPGPALQGCQIDGIDALVSLGVNEDLGRWFDVGVLVAYFLLFRIIFAFFLYTLVRYSRT